MGAGGRGLWDGGQVNSITFRNLVAYMYVQVIYSLRKVGGVWGVVCL